MGNCKFTFLLTMATIFTLMGCSSKVEEKEHVETSFDVGRVSLVSYKKVASQKSAYWKDFPVANRIELKTCLSNPVLDKRIDREDFLIITPSNKVSLRSNEVGCLNWQVDVDYNPTEREKFVMIPMEIQGNGRYLGFEKLEIAINPWTGEALDSRYPMNLPPTYSEVLNIDAPLTIKGIHFDQIEQNEGFDSRTNSHILNYEFNMSTVFERANLEGEIQSKTLSSGIFELTFVLLKRNPENGMATEIASTQLSRLAIKNRVLKGKATFKVPANKDLNSNTIIDLAIVARPLEAPKYLNKIQGTVPMNHIKGTSSSELTVVKNLNSLFAAEKVVTVDPYQEQKEDYLNQTSIEINEDNDMGIKIVTAKATWGGIVNNSFNKSSKKILRANMDLCFASPMAKGTGPAQETDFEISAVFENGQEPMRKQRIHTTDINGCLQSYFHINYDSFDCEKIIPVKIVAKVLNGRFEGLVKERLLLINPWNKSTFSLDAKRNNTETALECKQPKIHVAKVAYSNQYVDQSEFKLNKFLHLSLHKNYNLQFNLDLERQTSSQEDSAATPITLGDYEATLEIYVPTKAQVDYFTPQMDNYRFLTATKIDVTPSAKGMINKKFSLPFMVSETINLSYKNLAILTIKPKDANSKLKAGRFAFPFFGNAKSANLATTEIAMDWNTGELEALNKTLALNTKIPSQTLEDYDKDLNSMEIYRQELERTGKLKGIKTLTFSVSELNNKIKTLRTGGLVKTLEKRDISILAKNPTKAPVEILNKLCGHFYKLPNRVKQMQGFHGYVNTLSGGQDYQNCMTNPHAYLERMPLQHVIEMASQKTIKSTGQSYTKARFKSDEYGDINRGEAFFAAYGDRNSDSTGKRNSTSFSKSVNWGIEGPGPFYLGFSQGMSMQNETYFMKNRAEMNSAFWRDYTDKKSIQMVFNRLTIKFNAKVKNCTTITSKKNVPLQMHICEDESRFKALSEDWYFVGDAQSDRNSVIADGNRPGDTDKTQIIRGKANFDKMWGMLESEDAAIAVRRIGEIEPGGAFEAYRNKKSGLPFENYVDSSFPGLIVPAKIERIR